MTAREPQQLAQDEIQAAAAGYRADNADFARWAGGYGVISHNDATQVKIHALAAHLQQQGLVTGPGSVYRMLAAADRVTSAAMWLVVHMTYARNVYLDGRALAADDFKIRPEGHTGGSLNMVPAYVGYLAANSLTGTTRAWLMGSSYCPARSAAAVRLSCRSRTSTRAAATSGM